MSCRNVELTYATYYLQVRTVYREGNRVKRRRRGLCLYRLYEVSGTKYLWWWRWAKTLPNYTQSISSAFLKKPSVSLVKNCSPNHPADLRFSSSPSPDQNLSKILPYFLSDPSLHTSLHDVPLPSLRVHSLSTDPYIMYTCTISIHQCSHWLHYPVLYCCWCLFLRPAKDLPSMCPHWGPLRSQSPKECYSLQN